MVKKAIILLLCSAALTACSAIEEKTKAGAPLEAASAEWVEGQTSNISSSLEGLEERLAKLETELNGNGSDTAVFKDIPEGYWAYTEIMDLANKGIIKGYPDQKRFYPERTITRYQAASMIVKALNLPLSSSPSVFEDVADDFPGRAEMMTVYQFGIFNGSNGQFNPGEPMKRRHMAMVLQRAFNLPEKQGVFEDYKDVSKDIDGYEEIKRISIYGIALGSEGYFRPEEPTKRSQFSAFIYRALPYKK
ncbi:S-layer homology domain-containing protein [Bacillus infantis]|uniref:S-layer homology domain-containing protein n=1 Tax=Bacillus infantis TaxID=324767 RepID=UPI003CEA30A1